MPEIRAPASEPFRPLIRYSLSCSREHVFDAWFRNSDACDEQLRNHDIACSVCGDIKVAKALMAPAVGAARETVPEKKVVAMARWMTMARELRRRVEASSDYVGERFPEEARRIHYGETENRDIYGEASLDEARDLIEEGVEVMPLPEVPKEDA